MANEIRVFIDALRAGKGCGQAHMEYCWARLLVPVDVTGGGDPYRSPAIWAGRMAPAMAADAFDEGKSDEEIIAAFDEGLEIDAERGIAYRPMLERERPTPDRLIRAMDRDSQLEAAKFLGLRAVAHAVAGGLVVFAAQGTEARRAETGNVD